MDSQPPDPAEIFAFPETICHRMITGDPAYYPQAEYHGRTVYFCTETCLHAFQGDPERFSAVHSKEKK
jgi:YHS domain-containing protein